MDSTQIFSQEPNKLIRPTPNCSDPNGTSLNKLNFFEETRIKYEGVTPLQGGKFIANGEMDASVQERFSVSRMERDQTVFFGSTRNSTIAHTVGFDTMASFNGTWGTESSIHEIFYKDIKSREAFSGEFEVQKEIKLHEKPKPTLVPIDVPDDFDGLCDRLGSLEPNESEDNSSNNVSSEVPIFDGIINQSIGSKRDRDRDA
jgi:hypothetical protein